MTKHSDLKNQLISMIARREVAAPDRTNTGYYGWKAPSPRSKLIKAIKETASEDALADVLRDRSVSPGEHDAAIRQLNWIRAQEIDANRSVVFSFDWKPRRRPEDANVASLCILEWLWRLLKNSYAFAEMPLEISDIRFLCVPEIWSSEGNPVPLHYHMTLALPEQCRGFFDAHAVRIWQQVTEQYKQRGRVFFEPVSDEKRLARYGLKQGHFDWVVQHTLLPIDLANYRGVKLV